MLFSNADDDNNDDGGIKGKKFTLDDVFNDTFYPKRFSAEWISGMSVCQFVGYYLLSSTTLWGIVIQEHLTDKNTSKLAALDRKLSRG